MDTIVLDFAEDNIHIGAGDIFPIDDLAVLTQLKKVFPIHLLPRRLGVSMNSKFTE